MPIVTTLSRKRKSNKKLPVAILVIVLVIAATTFFVTSSKSTIDETKTLAQPPSTVTNKTAPSSILDDAALKIGEEQVAKPVANKPLTKEQELFNKTNNYMKKPGQMMLPSGQLLTFPPPKEGETTKVLANGKIYECDSDGNWFDTTPRKIFHGAFESNFANLAIEDRSFIPAFLVGLDQDAVLDILKKDYVLQGDETEEEMAQINAFIEMKGVALDYIEQGGKFDDFVTEMAAFVRAERKIRANCLKQVMMLYKEGKIEEAIEKREALDAMLSERGYKPMKLPPHVRNVFGQE